MHKIKSYKDVPLIIPSEVNEFENTFSIIIGKNGIGKSRFLSEMATEYILNEKVPIGLHINKQEIIDNFPNTVITVSTSPFDKFKLPSKNSNKNHYNMTNYNYVGMRGNGPYTASAITLIASATSGLLDRFVKYESHHQLVDIFDTLHFSPEVQLIFKPSRKNKFQSYLREQDIPSEISWINELDIDIGPKEIENILNLDYDERFELENSIRKFGYLLHEKNVIPISMNFAHNEASFLNEDSFENKDLMRALNILLKLNIVKLMDIKLHKTDIGYMSLRKASSGEQCMLVIMLGIAGHIKNNSLIFIDEPEINLHPAWQEKFMNLLTSIFSNYSNCQFFIATHSPQMISNLANSNSFVTLLENNEIYSSSVFYNKSSDFQLAELFGAPGVKNEYVSRLSFNLLSKVKANKNVDDEDIRILEKLLKMNESIDKTDPLHNLIISIKEILDIYASNK